MFRLDLKVQSEYARLMGYVNPHQVDGVWVHDSERGFNIASTVYRYLVKQPNNFTLISDTKQYFGGRLLWQSLSKQPDLNVDVIDSRKWTVLQTDVELKHGKQEHEFDPEVWGRGPDMQHILLVMRATH